MSSDLPRLHVVTDESVLRSPGFGRAVDEVLEVGGRRLALHLRGPRFSGAELWKLADRCAALAARSGSILLINDRLDIAIACGAAGAQLGGSSFRVDVARRLLGPSRLIGVSVHDPIEAAKSVGGGADFVLAGTLYETPSHPGRAAAGLDLLDRLAHLDRPVIGIGGVSRGRVGEVMRRGAHGVAVIRGVWAADRPAVAVEKYLAEME